MTFSTKIKSQLRTYTMVAALIVIWVIFQNVTDGAFLQPRNLSNLLRQMSVTGILAGGMVLVIVAGQIDLSVGSLAAFLGGVLAVLSSEMQFGPGPSLLIAILAGITLGLIQGYLSSYQKIPAFIVTLGGMMTFRGAAMWITKNSTIPIPSNWIQDIGTAYLSNKMGWILTVSLILVLVGTQMQSRRLQEKAGLAVEDKISFGLKMFLLVLLLGGTMALFTSYEGVPLPVLIMLGLLMIMNFFATQSIWGRHVFAIGGNPEAAFLSGIPVKRRLFTIFGLMGALSAIAGVITTARVGSASPDAGQLLELDAIAACVIGGTSLMGGKGSVFGALLGALVIESLNNGMSLANMEPFWQYILKGLVLVCAVWADVSSRK